MANPKRPSPRPERIQFLHDILVQEGGTALTCDTTRSEVLGAFSIAIRTLLPSDPQERKFELTLITQFLTDTLKSEG